MTHIDERQREFRGGYFDCCGIGEAIRQAVIEITAAKQSLEVNRGQ